MGKNRTKKQFIAETNRNLAKEEGSRKTEIGAMFRKRSKVCYAFPSAFNKYVEGEWGMGGRIGIEHAFNCINGVYVDITAELVLGYDVTKEDYLRIIEISDEKVLEYCRKFEAYMSLVPYELGKECGLGEEEVKHF